MQKNIAVINPRMDDDEISRMIAEGIAGALFQISHQHYGTAAKLIQRVKNLSREHNRPVSIIQDASGMQDPLDLEFGLRAGADWVASNDPAHLKMAKKLKKKAGLISIGNNLPKDFRVDSVMAGLFADPDAQITSHPHMQIRHLITPHTNQAILDSILHVADASGSQAIIVSDLDLARALSWRRPAKKIVLAAKNDDDANRAAIYWGVHPLFSFASKSLFSTLKYQGLIRRGERVMQAADPRHVAIEFVD